MHWLLLACLVFGCVEEEGLGPDGDHLIVHVDCTSYFDSMLLTLDQGAPFLVDIGGVAQHFDWDIWMGSGDGPRAVSVTVLANDDSVATGQATNIEYVLQEGTQELAEITLSLTP